MRKLVLGAALLAGSAAQAGPFDGYYRPNAPWARDWDCRSLGRDGGAMAVRGDSLILVEGGCTLTNPVQVNHMPAVLYDAHCGVEGNETFERIMLMRHENGTGLYVISSGRVADWALCETE